MVPMGAASGSLADENDVEGASGRCIDTWVLSFFLSADRLFMSVFRAPYQVSFCIVGTDDNFVRLLGKLFQLRRGDGSLVNV